MGVFLLSLGAVVLVAMRVLPPSSQLPFGVTATPEPGAVYSDCAKEGGFCRFQGAAHVRYGASGNYHYAKRSNGVSCSNEVFGDPAMGETKTCAYAPSK